MIQERITEVFTNIIQAEIDWCEENRFDGNEDYQRGFIKGLEQAKLLCYGCEEAVRDELVTEDLI